MRKYRLVLLIVALLSEIGVLAQDWEAVNYNVTPTAIFNVNADYAKAITEITQTTDNTTGYAYMEAARGLNAGATDYFFSQIFWEQKFWSTPIFLHAEFRTTLWEGAFDNIYYGGVAYCQFFKRGMLAYEPLVRYNRNDGMGYQFSLVGGWDWGWCDLAHFTDWWGCKASAGVPNNLYNEVRFYVKLNRRVEVGCVGTLAYSPVARWSQGLLAGIKINL